MRYFSIKDEIIFLVEESPEEGYEARALGFSIFTEADSIPELKMNIQEAVMCHFEKDEWCASLYYSPS